jgi:hypothetical protein
MTTTTDENVRTEEHMVAGDRLVERIKELVRQGNIRRVHVKNMEGRTLIEIPLTIGVVGVLFLPVWAAVGAIAALAANLTIVVEKIDETPAGESQPTQATEPPVAPPPAG